ncbi:IS4 family transposase [Deinococcus cavernae]|uniref:IS4 family transposase n=1 Tax=Deinococcus cavernae TaxID=2320857 RepID=UPI003B75B48F
MLKPRTALTHVDTLTASLKERLPHHRTDSLRCVAEVILGILQAESTLHRKIALHIDRQATTESITRMVGRVFHDAGLSQQDVQDILLPLLPPGKLTLVMDRTNWKLGQRSCNLLVLGVLIGNIVLPLAWTELDHSGNSHTSARMMLVGKLLKRLPAKRWAVLIADREFIGREWFAFLKWKGIRRCIRIREDTAVDEDEYVRDCFTSLQPGQLQTLFERAWVYGSWMHVVATLSPQGERIVVASDLSVWDTLATYRQRWGIETTFSAMKTRGLNLEQTHMTAPERVGKLFGLLCIALAWMMRVGEEVEAEQPTRLKKHGRPAKSRTRRGYEVLSRAVRWASESFQTLLELLNTPFSAPEADKTQPVRY